MEVFILDDQLRRIEVLDRFESLIWTERYSAFGDFQFVIHSTVESRSLLPKGTQLAINSSRRIMTVESVENRDDAEGRSLLKLSGRSLESTLFNRPNRRENFLSGAKPNGPWAISNTPGAMMRALFDNVCRTNTTIAEDKIPFITAGSLYPADTILEPDQIVNFEFGYKDLYAELKEIADVYGLGFRLYRGPDTSKVYFDVYAGSDRTASQTTLPAVIFSPDLENLTNTAEFSSIEAYKNVAYVLGANGSRVVYATNAGPTTTGFDRRVLMVDASNIDLPAGQPLQDALEQRGKEELAKNRALMALDGELPQNGKYTYGVDYELGDLVEMRNDDGVTNRMRVTEQIFVDDSQGERSYPTLALDEFIMPGVWYAWDANGVWDTAPSVWDFASGLDDDVQLLRNGDFEMGTTLEWLNNSAATMAITNVAAEHLSGTYGLKITATSANGGVGNKITDLAPTPVGNYVGKINFKTTNLDKITFAVEEYSQAGSFIGATTYMTIQANGAWQSFALGYNKQNSDSVLRLYIVKQTAGVFYLDDCSINW